MDHSTYFSARMPLYMDIHKDVDASIEDVAAAHMSDLEAQDKHGVAYLKYWFNPAHRTVCCLVSAPDPEAAQAVHLEAHGLVSDKVIEVSDEVVEAFLGGSVDAGLGRMITREGDPDSGFRTVFFTDLVDSTSLTQKLGDERAMQILRTHDGIVRREIEARRGRVIKHTGDGFMAAFHDATSAIQTAGGIQRAFASHNERQPDVEIQLRIGMSSGEPVDEGQDLFGAAVQLARRVCDAADPEEILVSNVVRELCIGKSIEFQERGETELKGFAEPVPLYSIVWR